MNTFINTTQSPVRIVVAAAVACLALAAAARADDAPQIHVSYADLDLNSASGATTLFRRIRTAADLVCTTPGARELSQVRREAACVNRAVAEAVMSANSPRLTRLYEIKMGNTPATQLASSK